MQEAPAQTDLFKPLTNDQVSGEFSQRKIEVLSDARVQEAIDKAYAHCADDMATHEKDQREACRVFAKAITTRLAGMVKGYTEDKHVSGDWGFSLNVIVGTCYGVSNFYNERKSDYSILAYSNSKYTVTVTLAHGKDA